MDPGEEKLQRKKALKWNVTNDIYEFAEIGYHILKEEWNVTDSRRIMKRKWRLGPWLYFLSLRSGRNAGRSSRDADLESCLNIWKYSSSEVPLNESWIQINGCFQIEIEYLSTEKNNHHMLCFQVIMIC
jgi:hypothetical protein